MSDTPDLSALGLECDRCKMPIVEPGGVLFGVPVPTETLGVEQSVFRVLPKMFAPKWHLCRLCTDAVERMIGRR